MMFTAWLTLLSAWIIAVASPGPDFLAVLRMSASSGRRRGLLVAAGVASGITLWVLLALTGLSVVFARYEGAYRLVRYLGAAFLIAYGLSIVWKTRRTSPDDVDADARATAATAAAEEAALDVAIPMSREVSAVAAFRLGLFTNLANPKALVFFGALLASLIPHGASFVVRAEVLTAIVGVALAWFAAVAWVAGHEKVAGGYRRLSRRIDAAVGGAFAVVGVSLAAKA